jgi:hypothetical protein
MKIKNVFPWVIALALMLLTGCGERALKLSLKFNQGDQHQYKLTQDSVTTTEFMGKKMEMPSKTEISFTQKVEKIDQGVAELAITYDSFDMKMNVGGKEIPSTMGKSKVGKTDKIKINLSGEIVEPQGMRAMVGLQGLGSDVKNMLLNLYPKFPEHKIKVGDSWTQKQDLPQSQLGVEVASQYTFVRREEKNEHKCAVIDSTISMNFKGGEGAKMNIKGGGKGKGTTYFAYEKGILVESEMEMDIKMSLSAPLPTGEQEVPTTTHQKIRLSLI